jgi:heterodisulfide reductase subunit A
MMPRYGYGLYKNVITSMQMERQLAPTRPFNTILRPGDGKVPDKIAYVLCTGSRDATVGNPICSQICCMYSIKQAQLLMGALPMADVTIYYINIRSFGKGFEEFYEQAKGMGVNFIKGKIGRISEKENGNMMLRYEDINKGIVKESEHDMVVLSIGVLANQDTATFFSNDELKLDPFKFVHQVDSFASPARTSIDGVFVAGTASGPMDIPDSILSAGTASSEAIGYLIQKQ